MKTAVLLFAFMGLLVCSVGGFTLSIAEGSYTWHEAKADAEARGGSLAIIDTSLRLNAAQNLLISSGLALVAISKSLGLMPVRASLIQPPTR